MHTILVFMYALYALGMIGTAANIGKPRKPIGPVAGALTLAIQAAIAAWLVSLW